MVVWKEGLAKCRAKAKNRHTKNGRAPEEPAHEDQRAWDPAFRSKEDFFYKKLGAFGGHFVGTWWKILL